MFRVYTQACKPVLARYSEPFIGFHVGLGDCLSGSEWLSGSDRTSQSRSDFVCNCIKVLY